MSALRLGRLARERELLPGHLVIVGCVATACFAALSIRAHHNLGWMFFVGFVLLCCTLPLAARESALLTAAVLPSLLIIATAAVVSIIAPAAIDVDGMPKTAGAAQRTIAGIIALTGTLVTGTIVSLLGVGFRLWVRAGRQP